MKFDGLKRTASLLPFSILLSVRSHLTDRFVVTGLTALAIAASVSLAMSVEVSSRALQSELRRTTQALVGAASFSVSAGEVGVPEELVAQVAAIPGVLGASPLIRRTLRVIDGVYSGRPLHVVGLDLLEENAVRRFEVSRSGIVVRDAVRLLALPDSIVLSESFAAELDVADGHHLMLSLDGRPVELVVRGILGGDLADAFGGQIAAMDIYALQKLVDMSGRFERIDVAVETGQPVDAIAARVRAAIDPAYTVDRDADRESFGLALLRTYQRFLWSIVLVAVATSALLAYAVTSMSIDRRLVELSLLRAAGLEGTRVGRAVLADALVVAIVGTVLGALATPFVARGAAGVISIGSLSHYGIELEPVDVSLATLALGALVGIGSVVAAAVPAARRASRLSPLELIDLGRGSVRGDRTVPHAVVLAIAGAAALAFTWLETPLPTAARVPAVILAGIAFSAGLGHWLTRSTTAPGRWPIGSIPRVGFLIGPSLNDRVVETALAMAAWTAISACVVSAVTTIRSYSHSIDGHYYGLYGESAVLLLAGDPFGARGMQAISPSSLRDLRATGVVDEIAAPRGIQLPFRGEEITIASFPTQTLLRRGEIGFVAPDEGATRAAFESGELVMHESFGTRFGLHIGDSISLPTRLGARSIRIGAAIRGMAGPNGSLHLDESTFGELFPGSSAECWVAALWLKPPERDSLDLLRRVEATPPLFFLRGQDARRFVSRSTEKYRAMLSVPLGIGCVLGLVSLASLLFGATRSRQREFALLRAAGATRSNTFAVVALSGCIVGLSGALVGIGVGAVWASVFCRFLSDSIGWSIQPLFQASLAAQLLAGAMVIALISSSVPAALASRSRELRGSQTP